MWINITLSRFNFGVYIQIQMIFFGTGYFNLYYHFILERSEYNTISYTSGRIPDSSDTH